MNIGYLTDPVPEYIKAINAAETLESLHHTVGLYKRIAADALEAVEKMDGEAFERWRAGLSLERKKVFAGEEFSKTFGVILLPAVMLHVGMLAQHFGAPWGCAFIRMKEWGQIIEKNGIATVDLDAKPPKSKRQKRRKLGASVGQVKP